MLELGIIADRSDDGPVDLLALDPPMPGLDESAWGDATTVA